MERVAFLCDLLKFEFIPTGSEVHVIRPSLEYHVTFAAELRTAT